MPEKQVRKKKADRQYMVVQYSSSPIERATTNGKINWKIAFDPELVPLDMLIEGCPACLNKLEADGYQVVFLTSRPEPMRQATVQWLLKHDLLYSYRRLIMKPTSKQFVKTKIWKAEVVQILISEMKPERTIFIDDERLNIEAISELLPNVVCFLALDDAF